MNSAKETPAFTCDDLPVPVIIHRKSDGHIVKYNEEARKLFGFKARSNGSLPVTKVRLQNLDTKPLGKSNGFIEHGLVIHQNLKGKTIPLSVRTKKVKWKGEECWVDFLEAVKPGASMKEEVIKTSLDAFISIDAHQQVMDWNPAAEKIFGWKRKEVIGKKLSDLIIPERYRQQHVKGMNRYLKQGVGPILNKQIEIHAQHKKGHEFPVELTVTPAEENGQRVFYSFLRDISQRKKVEYELKQSELKLKKAQAIAAIGSWEVIGNDEEIYWSDEFYRIHGLEPQSVKPSTKLRLAMVHPEDRTKTKIAIELAYKGGYPFVVEKRIIRPNGDIRWVLSQGEATTDEITGKRKVFGTMLDITDRKKNEGIQSVLNQSLSDFQLAIQSSSIVSRANKTGIITYVNENFVKISGYDAHELIGQNHRIINSDHHPKSFWVNMWKTISQGKTWRAEVRNKAKNGSYYWVDTFIMPFLDDRGKVKEFLSIRNDITMRKEQEESIIRLNQSLADFQNAIQSSSIVSRADKTGIITYVNENFVKISGYSEEELIGQNHRIVNSNFHPKSFWVDMWKTIASGKIWRADVKNRAKDGTYYWVDTFIMPFLDDHGKVKEFLSIRNDITVRKNQEDRIFQLNQSLADFQNAIQRSSIVSRADKTGIITYVNENFVKISGYSEEELIGQNHRIVNSSFHPKSFWIDMWKTIASGKIWRAEVKNKAKDGTYYWVDTFIMPFMDEQGKVKEFLSIRNDITTRKKTEEELITSNNSLSETLVFGKMGSAELNLQTMELCVSAELFKLLDVAASDRQYMPVQEFLQTYASPDSLAVIGKAIQEGLTVKENTKKIVEIEFEMITAKGRRIWIAAKGIFQQPVTLGILQDITDQKLAELEIVREKELSESIINGLPGTFFLVDQQLKFIRWNKNFENVSGYTQHDIQQLTAFDVFDDKALVHERLARLNETGAADTQIDLLTKDGKKLPYFFSGWKMNYEGNSCIIGIGLDIAEQKKAEQEVYQKNRTIETMLNGITDGFFATDNELNFTMISPVFARMARMEPKEMVGKNMLSLFPFMEGGELVTTYRETIQTQKAKSLEHRNTLNPNQIFQIDIYPNPEGIFIYYKDISISKRAEEELFDANELFKRLSANVPGMIYNFYLTDQEQPVFPFVSKGSEFLFGLSPEELMRDANKIFQRIHPHDLEGVTKSIKEAYYTNAPWGCEFRIVMPDQSVKWISGESNPYIEKDGSNYWYGFMSDITASKAAAQRIAESELKNRLIVENSGEGILFTRPDGTVLSANPEACRIFGMTEEEICNAGRAGLVDMTDPALPGMLEERNKKGHYAGELRMKRKDGSVFIAEISSRLFVNPNGDLNTSLFVRDISDRKKLETIREELLTRFEKIAEHVPGFIYQFCMRPDGSTYFPYSSNGIKEIFNLLPQDVLRDGEGVFKVIHPEDLPAIVASIQKSAETLTTWRAEFRVILKDSRIVWLEGHSSPQRLEDGSTLWYGYISDITERKENEQALKQSEERFRQLYNHTPAMMHSIDGDGRLIRVSDYWLQKMGYERKEVLGRYTTDFLTEESRRKANEVYLPEFFKTGKINNAEYSFVTKSGKILETILSARSEFNEQGKVVKSMTVITDITDNKRLEREVEKLALITSRTSNAIIITDAAGKITWVNDGFERISEYSEEEVIGRKPGELLQGPDTSPETVAMMRRSLAKGEGFRCELLNYTKSKTTYWLDIEVMPIKDDAGTITGFMAIESDITNLKNAIREMQRSEQTLHAFMDHAPLVAFVKDVSGRYTFFNKTYRDFMAGKELKAGDTDYDLFDKDFADLCVERDKHIVTTGETLQFEHHVRNETFLEYKFPLRDAYNKVFAVGGLSINITEKLEAQRIIAESEERLRSITDHLTNGVIFQYKVNAFGQIDSFPYISHGALELYEYSAEEIMRDPMLAFNLVHTEDLPEMMRRSEQSAIDLKPFDFEYRIITPSGKLKWMHTRSTPKRTLDGGTLWDGLSINITSRKKLELTVQASEAKLQSIFHSMISGVVVVDVNGEITYANQSAAEILSLESEEVEHRYYASKEWHQLDENEQPLPAEKLPLTIALKEQKSVSNFEHGIRVTGEQIKWLSVSASPLLDNHQQLLGAVASFIDVTKQKNSQRELQKVYDELNAILNASTDASFFLDPNHRIRIFNRTADEAVRRTYGKQLREGDNVETYIPTSLLADFHTNFKRAMQGESVVVEREIKFTEELTLWNNIRYLPVYNKQREIIGISFNTTDITGRKRAEQELFTSRKYFESLVNSQSSYLIRTDMEGNYTFVNEKFYDKFHFEQGKLIGSNSLVNVLEEDHARCQETVEKCFQEPGKVVPVTLRKPKQGGGFYWTEWEFVALQDESGNLTGIQAVGLDATDRINNQLQLQIANTRLRMATKAASIGVWEWDLITDAVIYDEMLYHLIGIDPGTPMTYQRFRTCILPEDVEPLEAHINHALRHKAEINFVFRVIHQKSGGIRYFQVNGVTEYNDQGVPIRMVGVDHDITDRYLAENQLRESEQRFKLAVTAADMGIWEWNSITDQSIFDEKLYQIVGVDRDTPMSYTKFRTLVVEEDRNMVDQAIKDAMENRHEMNFIFRIIHQKSHKLRYLQANGLVQYNEQGQAIKMIGINYDITERYMAENQLRESEQRFKLATSAAHLGIYEWNLITNEVYFDPIAFNIFQMEGTPADQIMDVWLKGIHPEDLPHVQAAMDRSLQLHEPHHVEYRWRAASGKELVIEVNALVRLDQNNKPFQIMGVASDVTERHHAEIKLRESEQRFRTMSDTAPVFIWMSDPQNNATFLSKGWYEFTGRTPEEELGKGWLKGIHKEDLSAISDRHNKSYSERSEYSMEYRLRRKDGAYRWILDKGIPRFLESGEFVGYIGSCLDITERKEAEEELKRSRSEYQRLVQMIPVGVYKNAKLTDGKSKLLYVSSRWCEMNDVTEAEALRDSLAGMKNIHPDDLATFMQQGASALNRESGFVWEGRRIVKNEERYVHIESSPDRLADGTVIWNGIEYDITERKRAEQELIKTSRLYELTSNINQMVVHATSKDELLSEACRIAVAYGQFHMAWVGVLDPETNDILPMIWKGNEAGYFSAIPLISSLDIPRGRGPTGSAFRLLKPVFNNNLADSSDESFNIWRTEALKRNYQSSIALPIVVRGRVEAMITLYSAIPNFFTEKEVKLLEEVTSNIAFGLAAIESENVRELKEKELEASEERFRLSNYRLNVIMDNLPSVAIYQYEMDPSTMEGHYTYYSTGVERLTGISSEAIIEDPSILANRIHPEDREQHEALIRQANENRSVFDHEYRFKHRKGGWRWLRTRSQPTQTADSKIVWNGLIIDITEQKEAEESLQFTRFTIDHSSDGIYWIRPDGSFADLNPAAYETLGYTFEEMLTMGVGEINPYFNMELWPAMWEDLKKKKSLTFTAKHRSKEGIDIDVEINANFIVFRGQEFDCAFVRDITERKKSEEALLASNREKDTLIKEIHHRVKNNLQLISSILYIRMNAMKGQEEMKDFLEDTRQKIRSIALIHERLLQTGSVNEVEISDYLGKLIKDLNMTNTRQDLRLGIETRIDSEMMNLDMAIYCGLIINELVTNSIKHAFTNRTQGAIQIQLSKTSAGHQLVVKDNGVSLPENVAIGRSGSFGMQLLEIFIRQLGGTVEIVREGGTSFTINFR